MSAEETREALVACLRPLVGAHADVVANHLLASGLIPEGSTTVEWGAYSVRDDAVLVIAREWSGMDAEDAREFHADLVASEHPWQIAGPMRQRARTSYPDRVTDWKPDDED